MGLLYPKVSALVYRLLCLSEQPVFSRSGAYIVFAALWYFYLNDQCEFSQLVGEFAVI